MVFNALGWAGAIVYILAYLLLSLKKISSHSTWFNGLNFLGAVGVTIAAFYNHDIPSVVLNVVWGAIALASIVFGVIK